MDAPSSSRGGFMPSQMPVFCSQQPTQLTQKNLDQIKKFVRDFLYRSKNFRGILESTDPEVTAKIEKYREPLRDVFQKSLLKEGTRKKVFNYLIQSCAEDGGTLLMDVAEYWIMMFDAFGLNLEASLELQYRFDMFSALMEALRVMDSLSIETVLRVTGFFSEKLTKEVAIKLCSHFEQYFIAEQKASLRFNNGYTHVLLHLETYESLALAELADNEEPLDGRAVINSFLIDLLEKVTSRNVDNIVDLVKSCKKSSLFPGYVKGLLENTQEEKAEIFLRIIPILPSAEKPLLTTVWQRFCTEWKELTELQLSGLIEAFTELQKRIVNIFTFNKTMRTFLKQNKSWMFSSTFGFLFGLLLAGNGCQQDLVLVEMTHSIAKLFRYENKLKSDLWIAKTVDDTQLGVVRGHIEVLLSAMRQEYFWIDTFCPVLEKIGYGILSEGAKHVEIVFNSGRLEDTGGLAFFGRWILSQTHEINVQDFGDRIGHLISFICSSASRDAKLLLIDVFIELLISKRSEMCDAYETIQKAVENVCEMNDLKVAITLIRAAMPVIVQREELRWSLFKTMKSSMTNPLHMESALPLSIVLLLLKAITPKESISSQYTQNNESIVPSQSFATFSSQVMKNFDQGVEMSGDEKLSMEIVECLKRCLMQPATTKCILFRGLLDVAIKSSSVIVPSLTLILEYAEYLPPLSAENYIDSMGNLIVCKHPIGHVIQTISALMKLSILKRKNMIGDSPELTDLGDEITLRAERFLTKTIDDAIEKDEADLALDKLSDFSNSSKGKTNLCFAHLMLQLYDSLVDHIWYIGDVVCNMDAVDKLLKIVDRKSKIEEILLEKKQEAAKKKDNDLSLTLSEVEVAGLPERLRHSVGELAHMYWTLVRRDVNRRYSDDCLEKLRENLMDWLLNVLIEQTAAFDATSGSYAVATNNLESLAITSITLYMCTDVSTPFEHINVWDSYRDRALSIYVNVLTYLLKRYPSKCKNALNSILESIGRSHSIEAPSTNHNLTPLQAIILKHISFYTKYLVPQLVDNQEQFQSRKLEKRFRRQATLIFKLCRMFSDLTAFSIDSAGIESVIPNRPDRFDQTLKMKTYFRLIRSTATDDDTVVTEMWKALIDIGLHSQWSEQWWKFLKVTINDCASVMNGEVDERQEARRPKSISATTVEEVLHCLVDALQSMLGIISSSMDIKAQINDSVDDPFMEKILASINCIIALVDVVLNIHIESNILRDPTMSLLNKLFETMSAVVKQLTTELKTQNSEMPNWSSITSLAEISKGSLSQLMELADENIGCLEGGESEQKIGRKNAKLTKLKKEDSIYVNYVRNREQFQSSLIALGAKLKDDELDVDDRSIAIGVRDFRVNNRVLAAKFQNEHQTPDGVTPRRKKRRRATDQQQENEQMEVDNP